MKKAKLEIINLLVVAITSFILVNCSSTGNKNSIAMKKDFTKGTYGYDVAFFKKNQIPTIQLKDTISGASLLLVPGYQGRVMTSSAGGDEGKSFGWINYKLIDSAVVSKQFNPFGGEERLWLGPEGGPFSIYFKKGDEQVFANWKVPAELDTETFNVVSQTARSVEFRKEFTLINAAGTTMQIGIDRSVSMLSKIDVENILNIKIDVSLSFVAYQSVNTLLNKGKENWTKEKGFLSLWMLAMFNPSEQGVVFIPFKAGSEKELGKVVTDDYFGKVPSDRLVIKDNVLFFKTDGKYRSKIGISPKRAMPYCGSYDPVNHVLTLLWYSRPDKLLEYVNSKWGKQDDPLSGDAVNSYNYGPVDDGSIMGPFYEIESSSPAALLTAGEKLTHTQRIFHITGDEKMLSVITRKLFDISVEEITSAFTVK
jgi:hypothetical protein